MPTLHSPRLVLRPIVIEDIDAVFSACSNPRVTEYTQFETHRDRAESEAFIRECLSAMSPDGKVDFAIARREAPGSLIGMCGARRIENRCNSAVEFGYWLAEECWNQGYATEAVRVLVPFLFDHYGAERVQAHTFAENAASGRVLDKAGLSYEGTLRRAMYRRGRYWDVRMYSVLRSERGK